MWWCNGSTTSRIRCKIYIRVNLNTMQCQNISRSPLFFLSFLKKKNFLRNNLRYNFLQYHFLKCNDLHRIYHILLNIGYVTDIFTDMLKIENTNETIRLYKWFTDDREKNNDFDRKFFYARRRRRFHKFGMRPRAQVFL